MNRRNILGIAAITTLALTLPSGSAISQQKSMKKQLVGTWTFVSSTTKLPDGSLAWGTNPKGLLIFTANVPGWKEHSRSRLPTRAQPRTRCARSLKNRRAPRRP